MKDQIYDFLVRKNKNIRYEYERYVQEHLVEHYEHHILHLKILLKLNWHYRVKGKTKPLLYWEHKEEAGGNASLNINEQNRGGAVKDEQARNKQSHVCIGAESEEVDLPSTYHFAKSLLKYDVISFDIFDTLIFRPLSNPQSLFLLVQNELQYDKFYEIRISSELKARELKEIKDGNREINIFNIYDLIEYETGLDADKGVETEFSLEKKLCFMNPYMMEVLDILQGQDKRIILVTDMYYPKEMINELLNKTGVNGYENVYVSCEYEANKSSGRLFEKVLDDYPNMSVCHVGDNFNSDIRVPQSMGIAVKYYPNVQEKGNRYRIATRAMSRLIGSAYAGVVNSFLWNGKKKYSVLFEFGYIYGGIYILGFVNWIHQYAVNNSVDKVIFLSRDGFIYSKIFNEIYNDVENEYFYWSRALTAKIAVEHEREELVKFVRMCKLETGGWLIKSFEALGIEELLKGLTEKEILCMERDESEWTDFLYSNWEKVVALLKDEINIIYCQIEKIIKDSRKIAIVDVGWNGTSAHQIKKLINKKSGIRHEVISLVVGSLCKNGNENRILSKEQAAYAFSANYNRILFDVFQKNNNYNAAIFELFTQANSPMFKGYKRENTNIKYDFFTPDIETRMVINEIHEGIESFIHIWQKFYGDIKLMKNISGYDALNPFRVLTMDIQYMTLYLNRYLKISQIFF